MALYISKCCENIYPKYIAFIWTFYADVMNINIGRLGSNRDHKYRNFLNKCRLLVLWPRNQAQLDVDLSFIWMLMKTNVSANPEKTTWRILCKKHFFSTIKYNYLGPDIPDSAYCIKRFYCYIKNIIETPPLFGLIFNIIGAPTQYFSGSAHACAQV